ncbi:MAG: methylenetetrahydrofolate reductase C-terminal domain-containing protein [Planctomycetota bacterium]
MIIQKQKAQETIEETLAPYDKVFIAGCAECATACQTGGEEEVAKMKERLEAAGKTVTGTVVYDTACLRGEVRQVSRDHESEIEQADAILALFCGAGVQTVGDHLEHKPVIPGVDALFIGETIRAGKYAERCQACGECLLEITGGICPVTRCAKGLLNGPCGGYTEDGKCEVDPDKDCAWLLIYERLKERGQLDKIRELQAPKDYADQHPPRLYKWARPKKKKKVGAKS